MPDSDWQPLPDSDVPQWEQDYKDGRRGEHEKTEVNDANGVRVTVTVNIWSYPTHTPMGGGDELVHKCIRCGGRHDHYLVDPNGFLRPDVVYAPKHVEEDQWGSGRLSLYSSVRVGGTLTRRTQTETRRPGKPPIVEVKWDEKVLDHIEERDYVVMGGDWEVIDCKSGIRVESLGWAAPPAEEMLLASIRQIPNLGGEPVVVDQGEVTRRLGAALSGAHRPALIYGMVEKKPALVLVEDGGEGKSLGHVRFEVAGKGDRIHLRGFVQETKPARKKAAT